MASCAVRPAAPWLDTDTSQPRARKARSSLAGYASATGTPPGVLPCPIPHVLLSPKATMFIVSAHSRFAPIDIEKARIRIARACRMTSPIKTMRDVMRHALAILILAFSMSIGANRLCAETINIVAFGDSNTWGMGQGNTPGGVPVAEAY